MLLCSLHSCIFNGFRLVYKDTNPHIGTSNMQQATHLRLSNGDSIEHAPGERLYVRQKNIYLGDYKLMFSYAMAKATKLAYEATPTLNVLIANVESENLVRMRSTRIAQFLDVSEQTVERHLKKLRTLQIIIPDVAEGDKPRAVFNWRICPYLSWKGSVESLNTYLKTLPLDHHWRTYSQDKATAVQEHSA